MKHIPGAVLSLTALALFASSAWTAEKQETARGSIQEVRASARQVVISTDGDKELTLRVDERSILEQKGLEAALDQFKKGMRVKVAYEPRDGENRVISMTSATVSAEELENKFRDALQSAKSYTFQHKDEYRRKLESVLGQVDDRIDQLQDEAARAGAKEKKELPEQLAQLRRLRDKAEAEAERVKSATPEAWQDLKSGIGSAFEDLRNAFEKAGAKFR